MRVLFVLDLFVEDSPSQKQNELGSNYPPFEWNRRVVTKGHGEGTERARMTGSRGATEVPTATPKEFEVRSESTGG